MILGRLSRFGVRAIALPHLTLVIDTYDLNSRFPVMDDFKVAIEKMCREQCNLADLYAQDKSLKARRRRFQEFTRSLHREAPFTGFKAKGRRVKRKKGARAREQRTRKPR